MYSKKEKLSLLSDLIHFAKADKKFKVQEYEFIVAIATQLGVSRSEVDDLIDTKVENIALHPESQRILQFHRLVLLMNVDQEASQQEIHKIKEMGLLMGLRPEAIDTVLEVMHEYPNKVIPPQELMSIFSKYYN